MPSVTVARVWPGETAVCIGGGPSLTVEDVEYVRGKARVIAINDAYRLAPWADILYAADVKWWRAHQGAPGFAGKKYSISRTPKTGSKEHDARWPDINVLRNTGRFGLETDASGLRNGMHGGAQAIGLAFHLGVTRVLLLGYDCKATGGEPHWFGHHPEQARGQMAFSSWRYCLEVMAPELVKAGIEVINCSRDTALRCFPQSTIDEALQVAMVMA